MYYGVAWANDGATIFYVASRRRDAPVAGVAPHARHRRRATTSLVFQEDDERFFVGVGRTRSGRFVVITSASKVTSEVWLVDADDPTPRRVVVEPRDQGHEYHVEHHAGPAGDRLLRAHQRRRRRELQARR